DGIDDVRVSFTTETIEGSGSVSGEQLRRRVEALGYRLVCDAAAGAPAPETRGVRRFAAFVWRKPSSRLTLLLGLAALVTAPLAFGDPAAQSAVALLHYAIIAVVGYPIARRGISSLLYARRITIDL